MYEKINNNLVRKKRPISLDTANPLKIVFFSAITGLFLYFIFIQFLLLLNNQQFNQDQLLSALQISDPEFFIYINLIIIFLAPYNLVAQPSVNNWLNLFYLLIPWFISGFLTGVQFGPKRQNSVLAGSLLPINLGIIGLGTIIYSLITIFFLPSFSSASTSPFLYYVIVILIIAIIFLFSIIFSLIFISIPMLLGYKLSSTRFNVSRQYPLIFLARPSDLIFKNSLMRNPSTGNNQTLLTSRSGLNLVKTNDICPYYQIKGTQGLCKLLFQDEKEQFQCSIQYQFNNCIRYKSITEENT